MTCKDCIHYEVCDWDKDKYDKSIITSFPNCDKKNCGLFQNKADYVEVVRCCECKHNITTSDIQVYYCKERNLYTDKRGFCHCGEREDT